MILFDPEPIGRHVAIFAHALVTLAFYLLDPDVALPTSRQVGGWSEEYTFGDQQAVLTYWHRPLHAMSDAFTEAGFRIAVISEPPFSPDTPKELLPPGLGDRTAFICFIFFVLEAL